MKIVVCKVRECPEVVEINDDYREIQKIVGGCFEFVNYGDYMICCDDEGKLKGKEINYLMMDADGNIVDTLVGDIFVTKPGLGGELESLTDEDIEKIKKIFSNREI